MKKLLVIWHSRTHTSEQVAQAAYRGALDSQKELQQEADIRLRSVYEVGLEELLSADAYVFCAPENLGSVSGLMKEFFDRYYYALLDRVEGRPYALIISAGSDGQGAIRQVQRILTGWRLREQVKPLLIITGAQTAQAIAAPKSLSSEQYQQAYEVGATLSALL